MLEMLEILEPHAMIISAVSAFITAVAVIISTGFVCFRKTRRDKVDELKLEILELVSNVKGNKDWIIAMDLSEIQGVEGIVKVKDLIKLLHKNYDKKKWHKLLPVALAELRNEGYHEQLGMPPTTKIMNQPLRINVGSPDNQ